MFPYYWKTYFCLKFVANLNQSSYYVCLIYRYRNRKHFLTRCQNRKYHRQEHEKEDLIYRRRSFGKHSRHCRFKEGC